MNKLSPGLIETLVLLLLIRLILFSGLILIVPVSGTVLLLTSFKVRSTSSSFEALTSGLEGIKTIVQSFDCALSSTESKMKTENSTMKNKNTYFVSRLVINHGKGPFKRNELNK